MRFRLTPEGKHVFLSMDSRTIRSNPLYNAFKARSFTAGDVTFHFYILDLLQNGDACTARQITDLFAEKYLSAFETDRQPDISTIRKKLKEYVALGLLQCRKQGRELLYSRSEDALALNAWADTLAFFSEADPLGVIGSTLLGNTETHPNILKVRVQPTAWKWKMFTILAYRKKIHSCRCDAPSFQWLTA